AYKTYYEFATVKVPPRKARKYKKVASPSRKLSIVKEAEPVKKGKRVKRPTKKSTTDICEDDNDDDSDDNNKGDDDKADSDDDGNSDALYKDVDVRSLETEHEKERQDDEEMTDADLNVSQELPYDQVIEDAHVTLTTSQKTDDSKQSSSVYPNLIANFSSWKMFH
ncbi:hypothetical protein Tco_0130704, partial [Tanacetum coccineum]